MSKKEKKIPDMSKFAVLIFCWGRPHFHNTLDALRNHGYTGRVIMLLDNLDKTNEEYIRLYGNENTYVFNKNFVARKCDPMNNFGNIMSMYQQMKSNPAQLLSKRFNIPQGVDTSNPDSIIQHLLNTGQVSENQINQARNNPIIQMFMNRN